MCTLPFIALQADSAEGVKEILLCPSTEHMLLKMNWKIRKGAAYKIKNRAAEFGVEVPADFGGFNSPKQSTSKHLLTASMGPYVPMPAAAAEAIKGLRAT